MNESRIIEIQEKTMKKKNEDELRAILSNKSKWEPEAIEAARKELDERSKPKTIDVDDELLSMDTDSLLREQVLITRELKNTLNALNVSAITRELQEQTKKLKNISIAASLFTILVCISLIFGSCS